MSATLHILALIVSVMCLAFSVKAATKSQWQEAATDLVMVGAMTFYVIDERDIGKLACGAVLITLALIEALWSRIERQGTSNGHAHRAICLLIMGAATLTMLEHSFGVSPVVDSHHSHIPTLAFIGIAGLGVVVTLAIRSGSRLNPSTAGMLAATGLMSVASLTT